MKRGISLLLLLLSAILLATPAAFGFQGDPKNEIKNVKVIDLQPPKLMMFDEFKAFDAGQAKKVKTYWSILSVGNIPQYAASVGQSSFVWQEYGGSEAMDGKSNTLWIEDAKGTGAGEWIDIAIWNYASEEVFAPSSLTSAAVLQPPSNAKSCRVKTALLIVFMATKGGDGESGQWFVYRLALQDTDRMQIFDLSKQAAAKTYCEDELHVWFQIESAYPGAKTAKPGIAEFVVAGEVKL